MPFQRKWPVVTGVSLIAFIIAGTGAAVLGPLFGPIMKELEWSNTQTSSLATAYTVGGLLSTLAVGVGIDRFGARAVMLFGACVASSGLLVAAHGHTWPVMLTTFTAVGIGVNASFYLPSTVVISSWMGTKRNLGMGVVMGSMSAGATLLSPLIAWSTELHGWRTTLDAIAILTGATLPLIWVTARTNPEQAWRMTPLHKSPDPLVPRSLLFSPVFLLVSSSGALVNVGMLAIYYHVVPLLIKAGYSDHTAGIAFGASWLVSGLGSLALGVIADRLGTKRVLAWSLLVCAVGTVFLLSAGITLLGIASVCAFVLLWGAAANSFQQLAPVIFAERFSLDHLGSLIGIQYTVAGIAGAIAPITTGLLFDRFGDYRLAVLFSAASTLVGFLLILLIQKVASSECDAVIASE